jgi:hypothetical protein
MRTTLRRIGSRLRPSVGLASKDLSRLESQGLAPVEWIDVPLAELRVQYRSEWRMEEVYPHGDLALVRSPFADLIDEYMKVGREQLRRAFRDTSYYALFRHFSSIGYQIDWSTGKPVEFRLSDTDIWARMTLFFDTYQSILRRGYLGRGFAHRPIIVLREPYEVQRFGLALPWSGYEIWSGHHRGASLAGQGHQRACAMLARYGGA